MTKGLLSVPGVVGRLRGKSDVIRNTTLILGWLLPITFSVPILRRKREFVLEIDVHLYGAIYLACYYFVKEKHPRKTIRKYVCGISGERGTLEIPTWRALNRN